MWVCIWHETFLHRYVTVYMYMYVYKRDKSVSCSCQWGVAQRCLVETCVYTAGTPPSPPNFSLLPAPPHTQITHTKHIHTYTNMCWYTNPYAYIHTAQRVGPTCVYLHMCAFTDYRSLLQKNPIKETWCVHSQIGAWSVMCAFTDRLMPTYTRELVGTHMYMFLYGVATISRLLKITGLFCKRTL